jgi:hypothetical protein
LAWLKYFNGERVKVAPPASAKAFPPEERREPVPRVYSLIANAAFPPETVKLMGEVFDHTWASIQPQYEERPDTETELARLALAKAVVMLAGLGVRRQDLADRLR